MENSITDINHINGSYDISDFICPISNEFFLNPVMAADGYFYEEDLIKEWFLTRDKSPMTQQKVSHKELYPAVKFKCLLNSFFEKNPKFLELRYVRDTRYIKNIATILDIINGKYSFDKLLEYNNFMLNHIISSNMSFLTILLIRCTNNDNAIKHVLSNSIDINEYNQNDIRPIQEICNKCSDDVINYALTITDLNFVVKNDISPIIKYTSRYRYNLPLHYDTFQKIIDNTIQDHVYSSSRSLLGIILEIGSIDTLKLYCNKFVLTIKDDKYYIITMANNKGIDFLECIKSYYKQHNINISSYLNEYNIDNTDNIDNEDSINTDDY